MNANRRRRMRVLLAGAPRSARGTRQNDPDPRKRVGARSEDQSSDLAPSPTERATGIEPA